MPASPRPSDPDNPTAQKRNGPPGKKMGATDKQTGMDGKDFAKAIGINKPANVRDKIKRWQQDIEPDVATTPAATTKDPATQDATPASAPAPKPSTTPKSKPLDDKPNWKPAHERGKSVGASPERPGAAKKTPIPHNELDEDVLTATAPKKRVISDSHWRSKQPLPKENAGRPQPKTIPNAWVRPSRIIPKKPASPELKPIAPVTPVSNPLLPLAEYIGKSTGQIKPPPKQRRPSKPSSSGSDQRPTSSGGGSAKGTKSEGAPSPSKSPKLDKEKTELVRVRPSRRRARTSPRGSMSADDLARFPHKPSNKSDTALSEDPNLVVTVEYEEESAVSFPRESRFTSPRNEELRERRRRRRPRSQGDRTADEALRSPQKPSRRKSRRSYPRTEEEAATPLTIPAVLDSTPTKPAGSRLEAWLNMTPDPLAEPKSRPRRRRSKTSVSSTESPSNLGTSEVTLSTEVTEEASIKKTRSRRRRKSKESASSADLSATAGRSEVTISTQITRDEPVKESQKRRASKESVSSLDLPYPVDQSNVSASTERTRDESVDKHHSRSSSGSGSGSGSRRRRRRRSRRSSHEMTVKTQDLEDAPSTVTSDTMTETTVQDKDSEVSFASSPSLKRRGARRSQYSPTKGRSMSSPLREAISIDDMPKEESPDKDADPAAPTSPVDDRLSDLMPQPLRPRQILGPRKFPSRGKRLSTIASESARSDAPTALSEVPRPRAPSSEVGSFFNPETSTIISRQSTRRRKLARHEDLMSVLSMPKATGSKSIVSARSIRTNRSRLANATVEDIMNELASDEAKYMRELRTLVDGVIPVLLSCVLNKSEAAIAAGLFSRSKTSDPSEITKPIVDMGVCLERLKSLHKRVPKEDSDELISWAQSAQRVYSDYISVWRLGFQDVVISLAPADEDPFKPAKVVNGPDDGAPWDEGMPRNAEGYVVNSDGERVDVAYMLKRPLVRLKYLSKSLKGINYVQPSERVEKVSSIFQDLVIAARKRSNDEQARLEDEAAANIDPTRARDPRSLAPLAGVRVDPTRCVRARDHFDLHLYHSSGQEISCRVEILLRDNAPGQEAGGDILICEVDSTGRWLLLPPVQLSNASARNGDAKGEIFVMIRGTQTDGSEWSEVMSLISDDEQAGFEWVQMLGLHPIPPQMSEIRKIQAATSEAQRTSSSHGSSSPTNETRSTLPDKSRTPSPHEIDIPIGEQHTEVSKVWHYDTPHKRNKSRVLSPITSVSGDSSVTSNSYDAKDASQAEPRTPVEQMFPTSQFHEDADRTPRGLDEAVRMANTSSPSSLKRTRAKRLSKNPASPHSSRPSRQITLDDPTEVEDVKPAEEPVKPRRKSTKRRPQSLPSTVSHSSKGFSVWMPTSEVEDSDSDDSEADNRTVTESELSPPGSPPSPQRGQTHRRVSSVPSLELPSIPRQRKSSQSSILSDDSHGETGSAREPSSAPPKTHQKKHSISVEDIAQPQVDEPPPPTPPHRSPSPASPETLKGSKTPVLVPTLPGFKIKRRSSSPLKHEYEPSTCTEESSESEEDSESEEEVDEEAEESVTSESSEDEFDDDVPMPLMPIGYIGPRGYSSRPLATPRETSRPTTAEKTEGETKKFPKVSPPPSIYTLPNGTITPSQSASNSPYRTVPQNSGKASRTVASLFAWSEQGKWDSLHPDECSVVITPGKIEVFEISSNHSKPFLADGDEIITPEGSAPLVAVELTPLVPLRKSTAIDISIRSPPTAESRLKPGNNIMLRSRNAAECTQLYSLINQSRINNPTYIALQNARGPYGQSSWAEAMDRQNAARTSNDGSSGWLGGTLGRRSSYRKSSTRAASISAATESSVGTMNSALRSALGRFSFGKSGVFSIRNSTLGSRSTGSSFDSGSNSRPGSGASTPNGDLMRAHGAPPGITETKCRLYERESLKKWRDMGSARLTIMLPSPNPSIPSSPTNSRQRAPGTRDHRQERRIVLTGKKHGEVLLDVQLSETCFERVARSGIAVSVWEDNVDEAGQIGGVSKTGGVLGARARIFMIQMKSERECAYCFSLLGKLRY